MMQRCIQPAQRAQISAWSVSNAVETRLCPAAHDHIFALPVQTCSDPIDQALSIKQCVGFVAAKAAGLAAGKDRTQEARRRVQSNASVAWP